MSWPRIERSADGRPVWNVGPRGEVGAFLDDLPDTWPSWWPDRDWITPEEMDAANIRAVARSTPIYVRARAYLGQ